MRRPNSTSAAPCGRQTPAEAWSGAPLPPPHPQRAALSLLSETPGCIAQLKCLARFTPITALKPLLADRCDLPVPYAFRHAYFNQPDHHKEERLRIAILAQPPSPIGPIYCRWRWDGLRVGVPLAEVGPCPVACRPRRIDRRLVSPLRAVKAGTGAPVAHHGHGHRVDNDRAAITQVPPKEHAACLGCVAGMLDKALHDLPGRDAHLKARFVRPKKDQRPGLVLFVHHPLRFTWSPHTVQCALG